MSLYISDDGELLFSGGADSLVNVGATTTCFGPTVYSNINQIWSTNDFQRLYSIHSTEDVGDIFSIVYSTDLETIFVGAQDQSVQVGVMLPRSLSILITWAVVRSWPERTVTEPNLCFVRPQQEAPLFRLPWSW